MPELEISRELSEKLGKDRGNKLNNLIDFEELLYNKLDQSKCDDKMRENIVQKMKSLSELLDAIYVTANMKTYSEDAKEKLISHALDDFDIKAFGNELKKEIEDTKKSLQSKTKGLALSLKQEMEETANGIIKVIEDSIEFKREELKKAKQDEAQLKRGEELDVDSLFEVESEGEEIGIQSDDISNATQEDKDSKEDEVAQKDVAESEDKKNELEQELADKKSRLKKLDKRYERQETKIQTAMVEYKKMGFIGTFKRLWSERKKDPDNKKGFFSIVKVAFGEAYDLKDSRRETKEIKKDLYIQQCKTDEKIKRTEREIKALQKELKELKNVLAKNSTKALESTKEQLDNAIKPIEQGDITKEKIESISKQVNEVGNKAYKPKHAKSIDDIEAFKESRKDYQPKHAKKEGIDR